MLIIEVVTEVTSTFVSESSALLTIIESIVDEFECAAREGEDVDPEDIEDDAECLIEGIPYGGFLEE